MKILFLFLLSISCAVEQSTTVSGVEDIERIRVKCVTGSSEEVTLENLQSGRVCNAKNFMNFCRQRFADDLEDNQKADIMHTVSVLKEYAGSDDCKEVFSKLKKQSFISLRNKEIVNVEPFAGLNNLRHLDLSDNKISDISPLTSLKKLVVLALNANKLTDMNLIDMPKLRRLYLSNNAIDDLSWIKGMINLRRLVLDNTGFSVDGYQGLASLEGLQHTTRLDHLEVSGVALKDASQIEGLTLFRTIDLHDNLLATMPNLRAAHYLKKIDLSFNQLENVDFIASNRSLHSVDFSSNRIEAISAVQDLSNLQQARFAGNMITDLTPLAELHDLEQIDLSNNAIQDLTPLQRLHQLVVSAEDFVDNPIVTCPYQAVSDNLRDYCAGIGNDSL